MIRSATVLVLGMAAFTLPVRSAAPAAAPVDGPGLALHPRRPHGRASSRASTTTQWRRLDLPHDWSIEGTPRRGRPGRRARRLLPHGHRLVPQGVPHARRLARAAMASLEFDGVYMNSDVWINGFHLGRRPYGYISFAYDITSAPRARRERGRRARGQFAAAQLPLVHRERHLPPRLADRSSDPAARGSLGHLRDDARVGLRRAPTSWSAPASRTTARPPRRAVLRSTVLDGVRARGGRTAETRSPSLAAGRQLERRAAASRRLAAALVGGDAEPVRACARRCWTARATADRLVARLRHPHHRLRQGPRLPPERPAGQDERRQPAPRRRRGRRGGAGARLAAPARAAQGDGGERHPHVAQPARARVPRPVRPPGLPRDGGGVRRVDVRQGARGLPQVLRRVVRARRRRTSSTATATIPSIVLWSAGNEIGEQDTPDGVAGAAAAGRHLPPRGPDAPGHHRQRPHRRRRRPRHRSRSSSARGHRRLQLRGPLARAPRAVRRAGPARPSRLEDDRHRERLVFNSRSTSATRWATTPPSCGPTTPAA